ncbi:NAD(P)-binding protein [candidate division GN15 bacterium]|nr:NAD(P)-binding protein [candidate division GN15 bacterium]
MSRQHQTIVVGAGIAGLLAARALAAAGRDTLIIDKARGVGGRMATRWIDTPEGQARFDHGAQFFTVRTARFRAEVDRWLRAKVAQLWSRGFADGMGAFSDGHARYRGTTGMTAIAKFLAEDLPIQLSCQIQSIVRDSDSWRLSTAEGDEFMAEWLILTPPVPQSLALLKAGQVALSAGTMSVLEGITYDPCIAAMAWFSRPTNIPEPGGMRIDAEDIYWLADNRRKGISIEVPSVTIHATPEFSRRCWDRDDEAVLREMIGRLTEWLPQEPLGYRVHRWRYSQPEMIHDERCLAPAEPGRLVFAGDAFGGPKIEGAALSGLAVADHILKNS